MLIRKSMSLGCKGVSIVPHQKWQILRPSGQPLRLWVKVRARTTMNKHCPFNSENNPATKPWFRWDWQASGKVPCSLMEGQGACLQMALSSLITTPFTPSMLPDNPLPTLSSIPALFGPSSDFCFPSASASYSSCI